MTLRVEYKSEDKHLSFSVSGGKEARIQGWLTDLAQYYFYLVGDDPGKGGGFNNASSEKFHMLMKNYGNSQPYVEGAVDLAVGEEISIKSLEKKFELKVVGE